MSEMFRSDGICQRSQPCGGLMPPQLPRQQQQRGYLSSSPVLRPTITAKNKSKVGTQKTKTSKVVKDPWMERYAELKKFHAEHGHCRVPPEAPPSLVLWVKQQRSQYKKLKSATAEDVNGPKKTKLVLTPERIQLLQELDFVWDMKHFEWLNHLAELRDRFLPEKRLPVEPQDAKLKSWIERQWLSYRRFLAGQTTSMNQEKFDALTELNFSGFMDDAQWMRFYEKYATHHKDPAWKPHAINPLARWAVEQRKNYQANALSQERIQKLNAIGFTWEIPRADPPKVVVDATTQAASQKAAVDATKNKENQTIDMMTKQDGEA